MPVSINMQFRVLTSFGAGTGGQKGVIEDFERSLDNGVRIETGMFD
jgi:hypothetical protein